METNQTNTQTMNTTVTGETISEKSKVAAALLAFFLGGFGIHRFYLGKIGSGVAMLIINILSLILTFLAVGVFTYAILGVWVLVDFIVILCGNFKDGNGNPVKK